MKTTKRLIIYKRRQFFLAHINSEQKKQVEILESVGLSADLSYSGSLNRTHPYNSTILVPKNSIVHALITFKLGDDILPPSANATAEFEHNEYVQCSLVYLAEDSP